MKIQRLTMSLLLATGAAGAAAGCAEPGPEAIEFPATCQELQVSDASLPDAEYTLYLKNDETKPWRAHCQDMSTSTPREYLPLRRTGGDYNYGQFIHRATGGDANIRTSYLKLRIDPVLMQIDVGDKSHANRNGNAVYSGVPIDAVPFGVAVYCATPPFGVTGNEDPKALGNIDLSGTNFALADTFCVHNSDGFAVESSERGRVDFAARIPESGCAWVAPDPCPVDPWRPATGGGLLDIEYSP
jgi:hypothetical protein